jgi:hypothetical protein
MTGFASAKRVILKVLRARAIATVTIAYDGEGDTGQIGDILACDAKQQPVDIEGPVRLPLYPGIPAREYDSLRAALDDFAWDLLAHFHAGFEDNDGGYGTITIDVPGRLIKLDHDDRIIDTINTLTEV